MPESNEGDVFEKWVLVDENDKVVKRNISGYSLLDDQDISRGIIGSVGQGKRIYDISELEMEDAGSLTEIEVGIPNKVYRLKFPNIKTVNLDNWKELNKVIETIAKLNPNIPQQYFEAGSVFDDVTDWVGNKINGPIVPFKVFLESYFYWLGRNLIYDLNPDNENIYDTDYDDNEVKRFAKEATNGTWVMIPGISDFENLNYITEIKDGNDLWELIKPEFKLDIKELLDEIEVGIPGRTWDFTKPLSNFNINKVEVGDIIKIFDNKNKIWKFTIKETNNLHRNHIVVSSDRNPDTLLSFTEPQLDKWIKQFQLKEIEVGIPPLSFKQLVVSYTKYLDGITRAEMFDENGMYNSKLKDYHNQIKYYVENGTQDEKDLANFALSWT